MFGCLCEFFTFPRVDSQLTLQVVVPTTDYPVYLALRRTAADINCTATVATVQTAITHARLRRPRDAAAAGSLPPLTAHPPQPLCPAHFDDGPQKSWHSPQSLLASYTKMPGKPFACASVSPVPFAPRPRLTSAPEQTCQPDAQKAEALPPLCTLNFGAMPLHAAIFGNANVSVKPSRVPSAQPAASWACDDKANKTKN